MQLLLQPNSTLVIRALRGVYRRAFWEAGELYIVSAYLTEWDSSLRINSKCKLGIVVGKDFGITRKAACKNLLQWLPSNRKDCFYAAEYIGGFHPKAMFWKNKAGRFYCLVGSSNLTKAAFDANYEANAYAPISAKQFVHARSWFRDIIYKSVVVDDRWISDYVEATIPQLKWNKRKAKKGKLENQARLDFPLPELSENIMRTMLNGRRKQTRYFTRIRQRLENAIRSCADNAMSNRNFYNCLAATWGKEKFQASGWERTGRQSDFSTFCRGLLNILDADAVERDTVVVDTIDDLARKRVPTRGALLSELLCQFFPASYPVVNSPVREWVKSLKFPGPRGASEGVRYINLAQKLRLALRQRPNYPAKNLAELDALIWKKHDLETSE
jgi:hypothetical protein